MEQTKKRSSFLDLFRGSNSKKKKAQKTKNKIVSHDSSHSESIGHGAICSESGSSGFSGGFDGCSGGGFDGGGGCF